MPRTPHGSALQRIARRAVLEAAGSRAAAWLAGRAAAVALAGGAGCGASPVQPQRPPAPPAPGEPPPPEPSEPAPAPPAEVAVAVVGAGLAGLVTARRLEQGGVAAVVFEASAGVGGRVRTDRTTFGSERPVELGGELIDSGHERLRRLLAELGLETLDLAEGEVLATTYWLGGRRVDEGELAAALRPAVVAASRDALRLRGRSVAAVRELDGWSLARWLKERGITGLGAAFLEAAYRAEHGLEPADLSALAVVSGLAVRRGQVVLFGDSDERFRVRGGNDQVPRRLAAALREPVRTGHALEALRRDDEGRYHLTFRGGRGSVDVRARRVVLALPFSRLREVELHGSLGLSAAKAAAIAQLVYATTSKTLLAYERPAWRAAGQSGEAYADLDVPCTWEASRGLSDAGAGAGAGAVLTVYRGAGLALRFATMGAAQDRAASLADVERLLPGSLATARPGFVRASWAASSTAPGSYSALAVGQAALRAAAAGAEGGLHFAGEHTSEAAQGFMEGAVESGERAAREVLAAFKARG